MDNIKNPIPYYSLKQASRILNKKFDTDIYNPKSIVQLAITYDLKLYVFFYGAWDVSCDSYAPTDYKTEEGKELGRKICEEIEKYVKVVLAGGALIRLDQPPLEGLHALKEYFAIGDISFNETISINDAFYRDELNLIPRVFLNSSQSFASNHLNAERIAEIQIYATYPRMSESNYEYNDFKPNAQRLDYDDGESSDFYYPHITLKDVVITHYQLQRMLNSELVLSIKDYENDSREKLNKKIHENRGISPSKRNAKLASQTLADYFWRQDTEQKIRIKEMAIKVYVELNQTEHADQLPDKTESLQSWIEPIADKYPHSRKAGRPENGG